MNAQRWQEIQASFDAIVELDPTEQANRLASLGTSDPELQRAIQSLLRADAEPTVRFAPYDAAPPVESESQPDLLGIAGHTIAQFDVHEVLGAGGMGIVYRADDTRLGRAVALKFLLPHYNLDPSAKTRFLREARAVAALDHPNLCTVHEVGTTDAGWLFLAMSLYQGETLRARLTREGRIGVSEALEIARQVGEGLQAAHTAGIVHRDLKPGNIMLLPDGSVRILDFGLAKARDQSVTDGSAFGTLSYMSPEQIRGDNVDGRADLWALGVVLYEMLAGRKPFGRDEEVASALAILHDVPILLTTQRVEISSALEGLVLRLLQKDPAKRYADAGEFLLNLDRVGTHVDGVVGHLQTRWRRVRCKLTGTLRPATRRVLFGAGTVATLALAYLVIPLVRAQPASTSDATDSSRSIAVLPFDNVGGDSTNLPFSDGFADELTTALGKVSRLSVMARTSAFTLKRRGLDAREIGRQLHVQFIVAGSVRRVANRRRVTASLLDVNSGKEVWSEDFVNNALNRDVFAVQDSITRSIVRQLLPRISPAVVASSANRSTENSEAHDLYLQGRYFFEKRDSVGLAKALEYFERAIRADTSYALAYSGLADAYAMQATFGFAKAKVNFPKAKEYAALAMARDSTLVEVHTSLAFISVFYDFDWPAAHKEFDKALRLSDRYAPTHLYHAWYFLATDSVDEAISAMHRAIDLDPYSGLINTRFISILFYAGHYTEALAQARQVFERDSNFVGVRHELARAYVALGRCPEALAALQNSVEQPMGLLQGVRGYTYAKCGRRAQARAELNNLLSRAKRGESISHYALALIDAGLGDNETAIDEIQTTDTEHVGLFVVNREPAFASLHSDPRFIALVRKAGLTMLAKTAHEPS